MSPEHRLPSLSPAVRRRRRLLAAGVAGAIVVGGGATWAALAVGAGHDDRRSSESREVSGADEPADSTSGASRSADGTSPSKAQLAIDESLPADVVAQLEYARANWRSTSNDRFGYLDDNDCVNFASQTLLARGWTEDDDWWFDADGDPYASSDAWVSSTAFRDYLEAHPERATALTDAQRDQVKPGDIVQFDWDDSGDRDHTGIVTAVDRDPDGTVRVSYAGHTDATWDRSVDYAITEVHPGGVAYYWSIQG
ncbi:amidase domain-containing protein [Agromyces protaetiae]|nr:amidase domain-containing protein [Agromyces protaetiae]